MDEFEKQLNFELDGVPEKSSQDRVVEMKEAMMKALKMEALYSNASIKIVEISNSVN